MDLRLDVKVVFVLTQMEKQLFWRGGLVSISHFTGGEDHLEKVNANLDHEVYKAVKAIS